MSNLTEIEKRHLFPLLSECRNAIGQWIGVDVAVRLRALAETPTEQTWADARSIIVADATVPGINSTLWQILLAETSYVSGIPSREEVFAALEWAATANRAALTGESIAVA
ncbi:hypothetical protein GCM10025867_46310 (plasmid) [Frondihabitans sucicola]|uniref:Uncharacterized protein n=1 Tax=Frondihabitans sucicola TaxID=1268041 RepID=A0ABM8GV96_9MICO|nr:hypothetical protein [Frondihabitans sucicola]BDZ52390.1 hypothetical protein GCM10025867_46310 [Frondihabitans sucicola]